MDKLDFTDLADAPLPDVVSALERMMVAGAEPQAMEALGALLVHRILHLLREASRVAIADECLALDRFLVTEVGRAAKRAHPAWFGAWSAFADLLTEAARRSDPAAVESILRMDDGHGRRVLEFLAEQGEAMPRKVLRDRLGLSESHLSHVLGDLFEADLIVKEQRGREVMLELGPVGRDVVNRAVMPPWTTAVMERVLAEKRGEPATLSAVAFQRTLLSAGAPPVVARRMAAAFGETDDRRHARRFIEELQSHDLHFASVTDRFRGRPAEAFAGRPDKSAAA